MLFLLLGCINSWCDRFNLDCEPESVEIVRGEDADGDLWSVGEDCDDANAAIHPGAAELCNEEDDDCNGEVDEPGAEGQALYYPDADGDGYGDAAQGLPACESSGGRTIRGGDCDDSDETISPAQGDVPYDGIDQNCDGEDRTDLDGDGWLPPEDCDDEEARVNPGRPETCDDGLDNDCEPATTCGLWGPIPASEADLRIRGGLAGDGAGFALDVVEDLGGDRIVEILVGAPWAPVEGVEAAGRAYLALSDEIFESEPPSPGLADVSYTQFWGDTPQARLGSSLDTLSFDGQISVIIGSPGAGGLVEGAGSALVFLDPAPGDHDAGSADGLFRGDEAGDGVGTAVLLWPYQDDDELAEVDALVGAPGRAEGAGGVWRVEDPLTGALEERAELIEGDRPGEAAGSALLWDDLDGNGDVEVVVGAPGGDAVYLLRDEEIPASLSDVERYAGDAGSRLGSSLAVGSFQGDDGEPEILVGAPGAGYVALLNSELIEVARCTSAEPGDAAGTAVSSGGNVSGDWLDEVSVGAPLAEGGGAVYVLYGPIGGGCVLQDEAEFSVHGGARLGSAIRGASNLNGDSYPDLILGDPQLPTAAAGVVSIVFTHGL